MTLTQEFLAANRNEIIEVANEQMTAACFFYVTLKEVLVNFKETATDDCSISENMEWSISEMSKIEKQRCLVAQDSIDAVREVARGSKWGR
jgi:hypothetical protein